MAVSRFGLDVIDLAEGTILKRFPDKCHRRIVERTGAELPQLFEPFIEFGLGHRNVFALPAKKMGTSPYFREHSENRETSPFS